MFDGRMIRSMSTSIVNPHDAFFRQFMSKPELDDSALSTDVRLDSYLKAMKYAQRADLPQQLRVILVPELPDVDIVAILQYINAGPVAVGFEVIKAALQSVNHSRREVIMGHFSEQFVEQGRAEGEAKVLVRLLEKRFGPIPPSIYDRIFASDVITIDAWIDRVLEARELLSVFEPKGTA
jgi:hypothetical protein